MSTPLNPSPSLADLASHPAPARWRSVLWPAIIVSILLISAGSSIATMFIARSDLAFAIEPDYYNQAVKWDERMERERRSAALGWTVNAAIVPEERGPGGRIVVELRDRGGQVVSGATLEVIALFNARAADRFSPDVREISSGCYVASLASVRPGEWEIRLTAQRDDETFSSVLRTTADGAARAGCGAAAHAADK